LRAVAISAQNIPINMADPATMQEPKRSAWRKRMKGGGIILACIVLIIVVAVVISVATKKKNSTNNAGGFNEDFSITWAKNHTRVSKHGKRLELILDQESGMQSSPLAVFLILENKLIFLGTSN